MVLRPAPVPSLHLLCRLGLGSVAAAALAGVMAVPAQARELRIVAPTAQSHVSMPPKLALAGTRNARRVTLLVDGKRRRSDTVRPWRFGRKGSLRLRMKPGRHRLTVRVLYRSGRVRRDSVVVYKHPRGVDRAAPSLRWMAPARGAVASGRLAGDRCRVAAWDNRRVQRVVFKLDGRRLNTEHRAPWTCDTEASDLAPGPHKLVATASDAAGNTRSASIKVLGEDRADEPGAAPRGERGGVTHLGDYETGDLSQWELVQWVARDRIQVVRSHVRQGRYAARFEVRPGDNIGDTSPRAEVGHDMREPEGSERYYRWYTYFDRGFPTNDADAFVTFTQWRAKDESDSYTSFMVWGDRIQLRRDGLRWSEKLETGMWHKFVYHVKWSPDASVGFIELWYDDRLVVPKTHMRTMAGTPGRAVRNYMKQGLYKADELPTGVLYHDGLTVGESYAAADRG